jgi:hypothetical protein
MGMTPRGALLLGAIAQPLGAAQAPAIGGVACMLAALASLRSRTEWRPL